MGLDTYNERRRFERSSSPPATAMNVLPIAQLIVNVEGLEVWIQRMSRRTEERTTSTTHPERVLTTHTAERFHLLRYSAVYALVRTIGGLGKSGTKRTLLANRVRSYEEIEYR